MFLPEDYVLTAGGHYKGVASFWRQQGISFDHAAAIPTVQSTPGAGTTWKMEGGDLLATESHTEDQGGGPAGKSAESDSGKGAGGRPEGGENTSDREKEENTEGENTKARQTEEERGDLSLCAANTQKGESKGTRQRGHTEDAGVHAAFGGHEPGVAKPSFVDGGLERAKPSLVEGGLGHAADCITLAQAPRGLEEEKHKEACVGDAGVEKTWPCQVTEVLERAATETRPSLVLNQAQGSEEDRCVRSPSPVLNQVQGSEEDRCVRSPSLVPNQDQKREDGRCDSSPSLVLNHDQGSEEDRCVRSPSLVLNQVQGSEEDRCVRSPSSVPNQDQGGEEDRCDSSPSLVLNHDQGSEEDRCVQHANSDIQVHYIGDETADVGTQTEKDIDNMLGQTPFVAQARIGLKDHSALAKVGFEDNNFENFEKKFEKLCGDDAIKPKKSYGGDEAVAKSCSEKAGATAAVAVADAGAHGNGKQHRPPKKVREKQRASAHQEAPPREKGDPTAAEKPKRSGSMIYETPEDLIENLFSKYGPELPDGSLHEEDGEDDPTQETSTMDVAQKSKQGGEEAASGEDEETDEEVLGRTHALWLSWMAR